MEKLVERKINNEIATITLNRVDKRNAINPALYEEIAGAFRYYKNARAIILKGNGKLFSAGADLDWMKETIDESLQETQTQSRSFANFYRTVYDTPCPVISAVHCGVYGGALGLIAATDIIVASTDTHFCFSEVKLGLVPSVISPFVFSKTKHPQVRRYMISAESFNADQAMAMGLVNEVVPYDNLYSTAETIAEKISENGPESVRLTKVLSRQLSGAVTDKQVEAAIMQNAERRRSKEGQSGMRAFFDKSKPCWRES